MVAGNAAKEMKMKSVWEHLYGPINAEKATFRVAHQGRWWMGREGGGRKAKDGGHNLFIRKVVAFAFSRINENSAPR